ncbi:MAG: nucleoside deaminase [Melioribacteraceae bacterium]|nr:nucleoside deaminase [Melioribacteraceae bacterium]
MLFSEDSYRFMYAALTEAEKALDNEEVPIGAVVVYKNKVIGRGYNQTEMLKDPTAHAEMLALTSASNYLKSKNLNECDLYVTVEPCVMCTGALMLSKIKNVFFSTFEPKFGACGSLYNIAEEGKCNHKSNVYSGIYADESRNLLSSFFEQKRTK